MRLDKYLSDMNVGTRSSVKELIKKGHIKVNGIIIKKSDYKVNLNDEITVNDKVINYIREYSFNNCRDKLPLRFDFYLPDANAVIEFDGLQHFMPVAFIRMDNHDEVVEQFRELQKRDDIKNKYCRRKGIHMLRIKYDEKDIVGIIEDFLNKIGE